jgi:hypothetical protein
MVLCHRKNLNRQVKFWLDWEGELGQGEQEQFRGKKSHDFIQSFDFRRLLQSHHMASKDPVL